MGRRPLGEEKGLGNAPPPSPHPTGGPWSWDCALRGRVLFRRGYTRARGEVRDPRGRLFPPNTVSHTGNSEPRTRLARECSQVLWRFPACSLVPLVFGFCSGKRGADDRSGRVSIWNSTYFWVKCVGKQVKTQLSTCRVWKWSHALPVFEAARTCCRNSLPLLLGNILGSSPHGPDGNSGARESPLPGTHDREVCRVGDVAQRSPHLNVQRGPLLAPESDEWVWGGT